MQLKRKRKILTCAVIFALFIPGGCD